MTSFAHGTGLSSWTLERSTKRKKIIRITHPINQKKLQSKTVKRMPLSTTAKKSFSVMDLVLQSGVVPLNGRLISPVPLEEL